MKDIGEKLKETRESIGVSIEEVAEDLKVSKKQVEDTENGDMKAFNDIFSLKFFIRDYSKYLGLNYDELVDEFNEYLFDYTSKISIEDIKKATEEDKKVKAKENKIMSPYTMERKQKRRIPPVIIVILLIGVLAIAGYFIYETLNININTGSNIIK